MVDNIKNIIRNRILNNKPFLLLIIFVIFWIPVIFFFKIAGDIIEKTPVTGDLPILYFIHSFATPLLDRFFLFITTLGNIEIILPISLMILAYFLYKRQRRNALLLFAGVGGASVANFILKILFQRGRPNFWNLLIVETDYSFPSGHAMISCALVLCLILILWKTRYRWLSIISGLLFVGLVGLSRVYLGVHYPTDIAAGWCVSLIWVSIVFVAIKRFHYKNSRVSRKSN